MSKTVIDPQATYTINPNYQQWVLDQDEVEDLEYTPCTDHAHKWHLTVIVTPDGQGNFENEVEAWCQCGEQLPQSRIEAILNRTVQP